MIFKYKFKKERYALDDDGFKFFVDTKSMKSSEKIYSLLENGCYAFLVHSRFNKKQIKDAIEKEYSVSVKDVRISGYRKGYETPILKKAYVQLNEGYSIDIPYSEEKEKK